MKKFVFAALAAVAMVGVAKAAQSYSILVYDFVKPYATYDTSPCKEHGGWYKHFVMKQEDAQKAMGTTETVTYQTMAAWLGKNFDANKASVIANAEEIACSDYITKHAQYNFEQDGNIVSGLGSAIGVFFYNDGKNLAYQVLANSGTSNFWFDDSRVGTSSGWTVAVPEPTSAMLMLLGVAGLALKRKRA